MRISQKADWRIARAARLLVDAPYLKVPDAMCASSFSSTEARNTTLIMRVRRKNAQLVKEGKKEGGDIPSLVGVVEDEQVDCGVSPITTSVVSERSSVQEEVVEKQKKIKQIRRNALQRFAKSAVARKF